LRKALTQLSPAHREIIDLIYYHERSMEEVSEILQIPEATVRTRMFYARKHLAEILEGPAFDQQRFRKCTFRAGNLVPVS